MLGAEDNIVLVGMPGAGKSTAGVLLAKELSRGFIDTDVRIQSAEGRRLQDIIDQDGMDAFLELEEHHVKNLNVRGYVVATGGSVIYSDRAMSRLKRGGFVVYMHIGLCALRERLGDYGARGVVMAPGVTLADLHAEREPLYRRWADATVDAAAAGHDDVVRSIIRALP